MDTVLEIDFEMIPDHVVVKMGNFTKKLERADFADLCRALANKAENAKDGGIVSVH